MSKATLAFDPMLGASVYLEPRANLRGGFVTGTPNVTFGVVDLERRVLLGTFEMSPENAHAFSEYIRQEAELASVAQEDNTKP
jgi:hypothetical protein